MPSVQGYYEMVNNPSTYQLDKDKLQLGLPDNQKVYSINTCCWITNAENACIAIQNNKHKTKSKYYGVARSSHDTDTYMVRPRINGVRKSFGNFDNEEVAAAYYNLIVDMLSPNTTLRNDVPYMSAFECLQHRVYQRGKDPVVIARIIKEKSMKEAVAANKRMSQAHSFILGNL